MYVPFTIKSYIVNRTAPCFLEPSFAYVTVHVDGSPEDTTSFTISLSAMASMHFLYLYILILPRTKIKHNFHYSLFECCAVLELYCSKLLLKLLINPRNKLVSEVGSQG